MAAYMKYQKSKRESWSSLSPVSQLSKIPKVDLRITDEPMQVLHNRIRRLTIYLFIARLFIAVLILTFLLFCAMVILLFGPLIGVAIIGLASNKRNR